jgi:Domain of unknown function (DUF4340)
MTKRNNIYLLGSLVVMTVFLVLIIVFGNSSDQVSVDKNLFKVADQTKIDRVILKKSSEQIELHFDGAKWMVNNSFEADRQMIQVLFATLLQAEPRRPVAQRQRDSIHQQITQSGVEVTLFEGETLMKSFLAGGNDRKSETYYELSGSGSPYLVAIPGYRVYVAAIFELASYEWRDKRIFNFNWQNFKRLAASFAGNEKENFAISFQDGFFGLEGNPAADTTKLNDYLDAVSLVQAARYFTAGESPAYDSLLATKPYYTIEVSDIANRNYRLDIYPPIKQDPAVLGKLGDGQALLLSREDFIRLNRKKSHFER